MTIRSSLSPTSMSAATFGPPSAAFAASSAAFVNVTHEESTGNYLRRSDGRRERECVCTCGNLRERERERV